MEPPTLKMVMAVILPAKANMDIHVEQDENVLNLQLIGVEMELCTLVLMSVILVSIIQII